MLERPGSNAASVIWPRFWGGTESHALTGLYFVPIASAITPVISESVSLHSGAFYLTAAQPVPAAVNP